MLEFKPDFAESKQRIEAFWERELIDRPVVQFWLQKPADEQLPLPNAHHAASADRWLDAAYQAELSLAQLSNQVFLGDTLPVAWPNLGPEVFSAFYGCRIQFDDYGTSWTEPVLHDWCDADSLLFDWDGFYLRKLDEMTDALLQIGSGKFITGMTDWHPGGDAIAALRDPENLALDMILHKEEIKKLLERLEDDYFAAYDRFYRKLRAADQPISTWTTLISDEKFYVPSNDFSIMISQSMFDEVFLPGIIRECQFLDRSIYHLDGPGALRHLDSILGISELDALQFVPGAGNEGFEQWVHVYRRAQAAGKGIQVFCRVSELNEVMETLDPRGLYLSLSGVSSRDEAGAVLRALEDWCSGAIY